MTIDDRAIHNVWLRGIKGVPGPAVDSGSSLPLMPASNGMPPRRHRYVEDCIVRRCLFDPYAHESGFDGNYIGGIDVMYARNWTVSDNLLMGRRDIDVRTCTGRVTQRANLWLREPDAT